jgi:glycosyltransferase involved in cell wall biosynthesis
LSVRVALLTNFVAPYRVPLFEAVARRVGELTVFVSTEMERGRPWTFAPGCLRVVVQQTLTVPRRIHRTGYRESVSVHIPLDTTRRLEQYAPDVIVSGEMGARTLGAMRFGVRHRVPLVVWATVSERSESEWGSVRHAFRRWMLRRAAHVLVNGASGARYLSSLGVPPERMTRMPATTSLGPFLSLPLERNGGPALRLLCVGNLIERKAPAALLEAARSVAGAARPVDLTFVGDGPLRPLLEQQAGRETAGLRVNFTGPVAYEALPEHYARAHVLAFPTLTDEWGLVVNEALAAGVPVLGSRASQAVEELVVDGLNGWILAGSDPASIARGLERVLHTPPARRAEMQSAARASSAGLDPEAAADTMVSVIERVARART